MARGTNRKAQVAAMLEHGKSRREIGEALGLSANVVASYIERVRDGEPREGEAAAEEAKRLRIVEAARKGLTCRHAIAERFGVTLEKAWRILDAARKAGELPAPARTLRAAELPAPAEPRPRSDYRARPAVTDEREAKRLVDAFLASRALAKGGEPGPNCPPAFCAPGWWAQDFSGAPETGRRALARFSA